MKTVIPTRRILTREDVEEICKRSRREALKRLGVADSQAALAILLDCSEPMDRRGFASWAISGPIERKSLLSLLALLRTGTEREAWIAATVLFEVVTEPMTKALVKIAKNGRHEHNREAALHVLERVYDPRCVSAMIGIVSNTKNTEGVRAKAVDVLARYVRHRGVFRTLLSGLSDAYPNVRHYCMDALSSELHRPSVRKAVESLLDDERMTWWGERLCDLARNTIAHFGRRRTRSPRLSRSSKRELRTAKSTVKRQQGANRGRE